MLDPTPLLKWLVALPWSTAFAISLLRRKDTSGEFGLNGDDRHHVRQRAQALEREVARLRRVIQMSAALNATLDYERVLDTTLDMAATALAQDTPEDSRLVSALYLFEDERLYVASARGLSQADRRVVLPGIEGVVEQALTRVEIQICTKPAGDPELRPITALHTCSYAVCIPLALGLEVYGLLLFAHPNPAYLADERMDVVEAIAQQAMVAIQNARLYQDLEQEKERITEIQEQARRKLARDLHDGPTQSIGAITMRVNFARRLMERDVRAAADELFKIEELARRTTKEIRQMLFTLRPLVLESQGLIAALQHLAEKTRETYDQNVIVEADPNAAREMEMGKQTVVFYVAEEALNNARKHAHAEHIWVRARRHGDLFLLEVEDDGQGFDVGALNTGYENRGSLGMINLRERAELVNGLLRVQSEIGRGTKIALAVPMTVEAAERLHRGGYAT